MSSPKLSCEDSEIANFTVMKKGERVIPIDKVIYYTYTRFSEAEILNQAFRIWEQAMAPIQFKHTNDFDQAHIKIAFLPKDHIDTELQTDDGLLPCGCPYQFDGAEGVLAHAFPAVGRNKLKGHLHLDEDENWDQENSNSKDLLTVLVHEIGHCLNIGHSDVKNAIMYPAYTGQKVELHRDDLDAINFIYGDFIRDAIVDITEANVAISKPSGCFQFSVMILFLLMCLMNFI